MKTNLAFVIPIIVIVKWATGEEGPATLLGLESGAIVRCTRGTTVEAAGLAVCAQLIKQPAGISAMAVAGEFLYLGLRSGELYRCRLAAPTNCITIHTSPSTIYDLAIAGKHIYAAWTDGVTKCGLRKSDNCTLFYQSESPVNSLEIFKGKMYVGVDDIIVSCSIKDPKECFTFYNMTSTVSALRASYNSLYVGLKEGQVQSCELDSITECTALFETSAPIEALDIFDNHILTSLETGNITRYALDGSSNFTDARFESVASSIFTIYGTTNMNASYKGEDTGCIWQKHACPPYIIYYDIESRAQLELHVKDGKLYNVQDRTLNSWLDKTFIFVMDPAGRIYSSRIRAPYFLYHSSLLAGAPVSSAGQMTVYDGVITKISTCSEHYNPSLALTKQIVSALRKQGYIADFVVEECNENDTKNQEREYY